MAAWVLRSGTETGYLKLVIASTKLVVRMHSSDLVSISNCATATIDHPRAGDEIE